MESILIDISFLWALPFALMLLAIAVLPLTIHHWWEKNSNQLLVSLVLGMPVLIFYAFFVPNGPTLIGHTAHEYAAFIVMLASLFVISGGIYIRGDLAATPLINTAFLLLGSILASVMGTTGASMLLIRPLLRTNSERKYVSHTVIFFIFLVGNIGGCLTPLGDPPLFMGYLAGVPFLWTFTMWPAWAFSVTLLSIMYFCIDKYQYSREPAAALSSDKNRVTPLRVSGKRNIIILLGVVMTVALVTKTPHREIILLILAGLSMATTTRAIRESNRFLWTPMIEVAAIFLGIFITIIPALHLLRLHGHELGVTTPASFFWATGMLSAFLDNTPTYVAFFNLAQSLGEANEVAGMPHDILWAISLGSVFFGACTYIGNAPNFMIRLIAEERKVKMPSFFGLMLWSGPILLPVFGIITWLWMR